ncbi:PadR family transcriptional regulator [Candidatus Altiarchaeota archaeon]
MECCQMKGFLRYLVLWILSKDPAKGADLAKELEHRRGQKPSPGTIYPVLKEMTDDGLISADEKKVYSLTPEGEKELRKACTQFCQIFYDLDEMKCCCSGKD